MLGHQLVAGLAESHEIGATLRTGATYGMPTWFRTASHLYTDVDVRSSERLLEVLADFRPSAIVNAVGIVKQRSEGKQSIPSIEINSLFPHRLSDMAMRIGARVIQVSTDCVFSGDRGGYTEADRPDPVDLYGYTKLLGELADEHCLTLRTSIIGLEVDGHQGLVEWALSKTGDIRGFRRAIYSGLTTMELTRVVDFVLTQHPALHGVWHVASEPISKYDLLVRLLGRLGRTDVVIMPSDEFVCDRTLRADAFNKRTGYKPPSWDAMLGELAGLILEREGAFNAT